MNFVGKSRYTESNSSGSDGWIQPEGNPRQKHQQNGRYVVINDVMAHFSLQQKRYVQSAEIALKDSTIPGLFHFAIESHRYIVW